MLTWGLVLLVYKSLLLLSDGLSVKVVNLQDHLLWLRLIWIMREDEDGLLLGWQSLLAGWVSGVALEEVHDEELGGLALGWLLSVLLFLLLLGFSCKGGSILLFLLVIWLGTDFAEAWEATIVSKVDGTITSWLELFHFTCVKWV